MPASPEMMGPQGRGPWGTLCRQQKADLIHLGKRPLDHAVSLVAAAPPGTVRIQGELAPHRLAPNATPSSCAPLRPWSICTGDIDTPDHCVATGTRRQCLPLALGSSRRPLSPLVASR